MTEYFEHEGQRYRRTSWMWDDDVPAVEWAYRVWYGWRAVWSGTRTAELEEAYPGRYRTSAPAMGASKGEPGRIAAGCGFDSRTPRKRVWQHPARRGDLTQEPPRVAGHLIY